jgi:hypothetical protein
VGGDRDDPIERYAAGPPSDAVPVIDLDVPPVPAAVPDAAGGSAGDSARFGLSAPARDGVLGWLQPTSAAIAACWRPVLVLSILGVAVSHLLIGPEGRAVALATVLFGSNGEPGVPLLLAVWAFIVVIGSLINALCLAGIAALVWGWADSGRPPRARTVARLVGRRIVPLWIWFAGSCVVQQLATFALYWMLWDGLDGSSVDLGLVDAALIWGVHIVAWALALLGGMLGPVILLERGRGALHVPVVRALRLLVRRPRGAVLGLALATAVLIGAQLLADGWTAEAPGRTSAGALGLLLTVAGTVLWAVGATVAYAQVSRAETDISEGTAAPADDPGAVAEPA